MRLELERRLQQLRTDLEAEADDDRRLMLRREITLTEAMLRVIRRLPFLH